MLREAGYRQRSDPRELVLQDPDNDTEFFFLRPRDIAVYVGSGQLDVGITGRDLLLDSAAHRRRDPAARLRRLDVPVRGPARARRRTWPGSPGCGSPRRTPGWSQATSPSAASQAEVVRLDGAVETAVRLGVADVIADVVATGTTLRQAGLEIFGEPILESEAVLVRRRGAQPSPAVDQLVRRLQGVIVARTYVMMDYDIPAELVETPCALTPGIESPTVSPLHERAGSRCARWCPGATPTGSWTTCGTSAPAASSSPTSTPAGSDTGRRRL